MRILLLLALAASALHAATIRGVVLENMTGRPLARTRVSLAPVPGSFGPTVTARTSLNGSFEFSPVPAGTYLVSAARTGFAPVEYGQKEFRSAGRPVVVDESTPAFLEIRMKRFGAIAGTVLDENDVGIPDTNVVAYRDTRPPQLAGHALTDDRGMYRIWGLPPGRYLVRSAAKQFEDGGYVPTFSKQSAAVEDAQPVEARLDELTDDATVRVMPGALLNLSGSVLVTPRQSATVTLVSDMGRQTFPTSSEFRFDNLAPGQYELFAETEPRSGMLGAYTQLSLDRDRSDIRLALVPIADTLLYIRDDGRKPLKSAAMKVLARRNDLAGEGPVQTMPAGSGFSGTRVFLGPGHWELMMAPMTDRYVAAFYGPAYERSERRRPDGWNEIIVGAGNGAVDFALASDPGSLLGTVTTGQDPVVGAMVFLEPWDAKQHKRDGEVRTARADIRGHYRFQGLAPGDYRVMATFEYQMPDEAEMDCAETRVVKAEAGTDLAQDLNLFVIP
ncbi:MAG: carboxypeptidase-like regulatory domain-containing protein [Bryobacteraceae bacterium]